MYYFILKCVLKTTKGRKTCLIDTTVRRDNGHRGSVNFKINKKNYTGVISEFARHTRKYIGIFIHML